MKVLEAEEGAGGSDDEDARLEGLMEEEDNYWMKPFEGMQWRRM